MSGDADGEGSFLVWIGEKQGIYVRPDNIYQMFAYMKNLAAHDSSYEKCDGILLYPAIDDSFEGAGWELHGHRLYAKVINMNQDWDLIHSDLIKVVT